MIDAREPNKTNVKLNPSLCSVLDGHQHEATGIDELAESIQMLGQLAPVLIIEHSDGRNLIAAGRRRWMACTKLGIDVIANIWVSDGEDINLELFARAIRIAENVQRIDPSAMDVAIQIQAIRNERGFRNAGETAAHIGMPEAKVKRYLSVFSASDDLRKQCHDNKISLSLMLELARCEKTLGSTPARKLADKVVRGELSTRDLEKLRQAKSKTGPAITPRPKQKSTKPTSLRDAGSALLLAISNSSGEDLDFVEDLISELSKFVPDVRQEAS